MNAASSFPCATRMSVPVSGEDKADEVGDYYDRVAQLEDNEDEAWRNLPPTRIGAAAKFWAEEESPPRMEDAQADVEAPAEPQRAKSAGALPWRYLVIVGAGAICFLLFSQVDKPLRDDAAWAGATATGAGAGGLRGYLLDERNTRHRDEAKARLGTLYDAAIAKVEAMTQDPDARKGLVELLKALKDAPQPIASLSVVEDAAPAELKDGTAGREQANRIELADALATTLGKDLIGFAAPPEGETANVEVKYAFVPLQANAFAATAYTVKWSIAIRPKVGAEPVPSKEIVGKVGYSNQAFGASLNSALKIEVCQALFNQAPPFILPPPLPDDGD